jgi:hypothetical protein
MSNKKPTKKLIEAVEAFNKLYTIGTELIVANDFGVETKRTLLSEAWIIGNHSAIAKFSGISGGYDIFRVKMKMIYKHNHDLGTSYLIPADANGIAV